ncbi:MRE11 double-strand break repair endo/exonuclease [Gordonia phage WilliamBoone]|nr:MRE11 double-strand break repair endo/exonuclease [Gordonia phage WilliamBoone]
MTIYFTADLHLGHEKVELERAPLVRRSWRCAPRRVGMRHDMVIFRNLCNLLTKRDQLWILGDLSAGGSQAQRDALAVLAQVRRETGAELHLIPGNHDGCHPQFRTAKKWWPEYLEVFDTIMPFASRKIAGQNVCLSHYPYYGDHTSEDRHPQWRLRDEGRWLLHGHTHQREPFTVESIKRVACVDEACVEEIGYHEHWHTDRLAARIDEVVHLPFDDDMDADVWRTRTINVGLDAWELAPVSLETIAGLITKLEGAE